MTTTNTLKTVFLLGLLSALLLVGGQALGGRQGLLLGLGMAVVMNLAGYFYSDKIALSMYHAQPLTREENPEIYKRIAPMVSRLCQRMGIPEPKLWVIPEESPNAFATGRNPKHASVAFTVGLLRLMDDQEVEAVLAHELGHVLNRDILVASIAATIAAAITYLSHFAFFFGGRRDEDGDGGGAGGALLMLFLGPIAAMVIQMAISRTREYGADGAAAKYMGSPYPMISALQRLDSYAQRIPMHASPATAHMFIIAPFGGGRTLMKLFSTHPSTEQRIARLQAIR
ncbi:MAG: M48 family metalloprotease [Bryobacteraceae bacterium]